MKIKVISEQLVKLLVAVALATATGGCQRSQPSGLNEWDVLLSDRVQIAGLEVRIDGTPVQLPQHRPAGSGMNEMIAQRPASQKLRVELFQEGKSITDFTADWPQGNVIRLFSDATKGVGVSQCPLRMVKVRSRTTNEVSADLLLHRSDSKAGATVSINIPEVGWLILKVPSNQSDGILRFASPGDPTLMLTQTFVD